MKIILSPAKSLNETATFDTIEPTEIAFPTETEKLAKKLGKMSKAKIGKLMHISDDLARLNYDRYQNFAPNFTPENSLPAGYMFSGAAYQGLDFPSLSKADQKEGQKRLRILSGLYGLLKPFDLMQPYRLEMGTKMQVTPKVKNLYTFWGDKLKNELMREMEAEGTDVLVNLASTEYFKAAKLNKMEGITVITPAFKDLNKNNEYKVNMQYAKLSRGRMTRFIIENKIDKIEDLKAFDVEGYRFSPNDSTTTDFVFLRDKQ